MTFTGVGDLYLFNADLRLIQCSMVSCVSLRQHSVEMDLQLTSNEMEIEVKPNEETKILEAKTNPEQKEDKQTGFFFLFS